MAMQGLASSLHGTDPAASIALGEEALGLARAAADPGPCRTIALNMGAYATDTEDHDRAEAHYEEALALSRELEDDHFVGACLEGLGDVQLDRGRYEEARALYLEAAERALPFHQRLTLGACVGGLAAAAAALGEQELAARLWASFERWEAERGDRMQPVRRSRYEKAVRVSTQHAERPPSPARRCIRVGTSTSRAAVDTLSPRGSCVPCTRCCDSHRPAPRDEEGVSVR